MGQRHQRKIAHEREQRAGRSHKGGDMSGMTELEADARVINAELESRHPA